jgi:hypothetical protein
MGITSERSKFPSILNKYTESRSTFMEPWERRVPHYKLSSGVEKLMIFVRGNNKLYTDEIFNRQE